MKVWFTRLVNCRWERVQDIPGFWRRPRPEIGIYVSVWVPPTYKMRFVCDGMFDYEWVSFSSPFCVKLKKNGEQFGGKQVFELDGGGEWELVRFEKDFEYEGEKYDLIEIKSLTTGEQQIMLSRYAGFGIPVDQGKYVLREKARK